MVVIRGVFLSLSLVCTSVLASALQGVSRDVERLEKHYAERLASLRTELVARIPEGDQVEETTLREFLASDALDAQLVEFVTLHEATPRGLAAFAAQGRKQAALIETLLTHAALMQQMLVADGAQGQKQRRGRGPSQVGPAMQIYGDVQKASKKASGGVLQRLALAIALEHAVPVTQSNPSSREEAPEFVDPVARYLHYETAYLKGELDPMFEHLSTWELRMVVNGDEPDETLAWGREMLRNFRPDHIYTDDPGWRYVRLVTSDVKYGSGDVKHDRPELQRYQNILMNGGVCGRRAFIGRFVLRAFGIPTIARPSRGHGALAHWTPRGWVVNLGGSWGIGWTNTLYRKDVDFLATTQARTNREGFASPRQALVQLLGRTESVAIFDNCEHVPEAASDLIDHVIDRTDSTTVLATSREPLRLDGEVVFRLGPLDVDTGSGLSAAAVLFAERCGLRPSELSPTDRRLVEEIVRQLDGLPLALELASARVGAMTLPDLRGELDHRFQLLTSGKRSAPNRHRTLQAAVDWSFEHLGREQQAVLARSSVFAGRFTLDDAASVCASFDLAPVTVRRALPDLVDASLIEYSRDELPYRLLETLRQYGREQLEAAGESDTWTRNHGEHFTERACALAAVSYGPDERAVIDELLSQADEYRTALRSLRAMEAWDHYADLVWGLCTTTFWMRGTWPEPVNVSEDIALKLPDPVPPRWPGILSAAASLLFNRGLLDKAERSAALAIELAPNWFRPWVGGSGAAARRDPALAIERGEQAIRLSDPDESDALLSSLGALNVAKRVAGDLEGSVSGAHRLVEESQRFQTYRGESIGWTQVASALPSGALDGAEAGRRAFELGRASRTRVAELTGAMAHIRHLLAGDLDEAAEALAEYLRLPVIHSPPGIRILGAATAYFAVVGDMEFSRRLGNLLGRTNIVAFAGYPAVDALLDGVPANVDPMSIPATELEAMTSLALDRLVG